MEFVLDGHVDELHCKFATTYWSHKYESCSLLQLISLELNIKTLHNSYFKSHKIQTSISEWISE